MRKLLLLFFVFLSFGQDVYKRQGQSGKARFTANVSYSASWLPVAPKQVGGRYERMYHLNALVNTVAPYKTESGEWKLPTSYEEVYKDVYKRQIFIQRRIVLNGQTRINDLHIQTIVQCLHHGSPIHRGFTISKKSSFFQQVGCENIKSSTIFKQNRTTIIFGNNRGIFQFYQVLCKCFYFLFQVIDRRKIDVYKRQVLIVFTGITFKPTSIP